MAFIKNSTDLDSLFETRTTSAIAVTGFLNNSTDIDQRYEKIASGSNLGYDVGFKYGSNDIRNLFAAKGTVGGSGGTVGPYYDGNYRWVNYYTYGTDGKTEWWNPVNTTITWAGVVVYNAGAWSNSTVVIGSSTYTMGAYQTQTLNTGVSLYQYYAVSRTTGSSPAIGSFTSSVTSSTSGNLVYLYPTFSGGTGSIDQGVGTVTSGTGYAVYPTSTTTYTLTVGGTVTANVTVTVFAAPSISSFYASPTSINAGSSSTLYPTFSASGGSGTITGVGSVSSGGTYSVTMSTTDTYTLTATNGAGTSTSATATITVYPLPLATDLTASPALIVVGDSSILYPTFSNGTGSISPTVGAVTSGSSYTVTPTVSTTYTLTVTNPLGTTATITKYIAVTSGCSVYCKIDGTCCPAPDVRILMADGTEKQAKDLIQGDLIAALNQSTNTLESDEISAIEYANNYRSMIYLDNGRSGLFAKNHRFLTNLGEWKELQELTVGEKLTDNISIVKIEEADLGPVVKITVKNLHTYISLGVVSHNVKIYD